MKQLLVSVIITTRNEEKNIATCLQSIEEQSYKNREVIVVDNKSTDETKAAAKNFTSLVFDKGPERSAQRNFGAQKAKGKYVLFLDADMKLTPDVIKECVRVMEKDHVGGVVIPEESYGEGFWAQCKKLERSFYLGNEFIEAARFFDKEKFFSVGGFDENITGPEDWDLSQSIKNKYNLSRVGSKILHNEGKLSLIRTVKKKYYYAHKFKTYLRKQENKAYSSRQFSIFDRYKIFLTNPRLLLHSPFVGIGMLFMKTAEFAGGGIAYLIPSSEKNQ